MGREPTDAEAYLMHQQGLGFFTNSGGHALPTNPSGNPYPGMSGPQSLESFLAGWTREFNRRKGQAEKKFGSGSRSLPPGADDGRPTFNDRWNDRIAPQSENLLEIGKRSGLIGSDRGLNGSASLTIDLNGFPRGARTASRMYARYSAMCGLPTLGQFIEHRNRFLSVRFPLGTKLKRGSDRSPNCPHCGSTEPTGSYAFSKKEARRFRVEQRNDHMLVVTTVACTGAGALYGILGSSSTLGAILAGIGYGAVGLLIGVPIGFAINLTRRLIR